tara:strand:- start:693 stop:3047 length:2355 start_codon:yes stop_codon:yes gene_type:complete
MIDAKIIGFYDEFTSYGGGGVPFLLGNIGDLTTCVMQLDIHWESIAPIVITATTTITRSDGGSFIRDGFRLNDTFETKNAGANDGTPFTISAITDTVITSSGLTNGTFASGELHGTTPITAMDYFYAISPTNNNFNSMTDTGQRQKYNAYGLDCTDTSTYFDFNFIGPSKAWVVEYLGTKPQIIGNGYANFIQSFVIIHETLIVPLSLNNQDSNLSTKFPPDYFKGDNCLTWAGQYIGKTYNADPCSPHDSSNVFCNGNTGWYNENFNGLAADYTLTSTIYDLGSVTEIDACRRTNCEISIHSDIGNFAAGMEVILYFHWFAQPESTYQKTTTDYITNFHLDRAVLIEGAGAVNGTYYGLNNQAITGAEVFVDDANNARVVFTSEFITSFFQAGSKYSIGVIVQDPKVTTTATSDRVTILADYNTMICNLKEDLNATLMQEISFFQHPKSASAAKTDINGIVGDIWLAKAFIGINRTNGVVLNYLDVAIEAVNTNTKSRFDLERRSYNLKQFIPDANYAQLIDIHEPRNWNTWTEYDFISFKRNASMDDATYNVYELNYPVRLMDESFRRLSAAGAYFQNPTNNWSQYSNNGDWVINFNLYTEVQGQQVQVNMFEQAVTIRNYEVSGAAPAFDFNITSIETWKAGTGVNTQGVISSVGSTLIKVNVAGDFTSFPMGFDGFYGVLALCSVQTGSCDFASTNLRVDPASVWLGINPDTDPYIRLTITSNTTAVIESQLDGNKFDKGVNASTYYITGKIGYLLTEQLLAQENQAFILQENGFGILIN